MTDPSLIIYHPVRLLPNGLLVVTNGDQTEREFQLSWSFRSLIQTYRDTLLSSFRLSQISPARPSEVRALSSTSRGSPRG